jgi:hypothetical protein
VTPSARKRPFLTSAAAHGFEARTVWAYLVELAITPSQGSVHDPKPSNTGMTISQMPNRTRTGIPIYVAANGPKACEATGAYGDGWITEGRGAPEVASRLEHIKSGAAAAQRKIGQDFHTALLTAGCVLRPGEKLTGERVINQTGSWVTCELRLFYEIWKKHGQKNELVPQHFAKVWEDYLERVKSYRLPENARFRQIRDDHCTFMQPTAIDGGGAERLIGVSATGSIGLIFYSRAISTELPTHTEKIEVTRHDPTCERSPVPVGRVHRPDTRAFCPYPRRTPQT